MQAQYETGKKKTEDEVANVAGGAIEDAATKARNYMDSGNSKVMKFFSGETRYVFRILFVSNY